MENIYFTYEEFKNIKRKNKFCKGGEAKLYYYNNDLIKVYFNYLVQHKERTIDYILRRDKINGCVLPKGKVYIQGTFKGITMDYYKGFKTLDKTLKNNDINFKDRLILCKKLTESLKELHKQEIAHTDISLKNVISEKEDILLIDIDGGVPQEDTNHIEFEQLIKDNQYNLMMTTLSYIYKFDFEKFISNYGLDYFKHILSCFPISKDLNNYIVKLIERKHDINEYVDNYLGDMKDGMVNQAVKLFTK